MTTMNHGCVDVQDQVEGESHFHTVELSLLITKPWRLSRCTNMCILLPQSSSGQLLHLHIVRAVTLLFDAVFTLVLCPSLFFSPGVTQSQIAFLIWCFELHVSWSARADKREVPVLEPRIESKGSIAVLLTYSLVVSPRAMRNT